MNEREQLEAILTNREYSQFWADEQSPGCEVHAQHGINIQIIQQANRARWQATWPDGTLTTSPEFGNVQAAKMNLREHLTNRLRELIYANTPPARVDWP
jgi:hypothetical protein